MRILLYSKFPYALNQVSKGAKPIKEPSGAAAYLTDLLALGLAELGCEVFYYADGKMVDSVHDSLQFVTEFREDVDIWHNLESDSIPWVRTVHSFPLIENRNILGPNSIYVSRSLAQQCGYERYVHNALNPSDFIYSEEKENYFLFISSFGRGERRWWLKGLDIALEACKASGVRLIVAGTTNNQKIISFVENLCKESGAEYVGDVRGEEKASLLARAKALFFPTRIEKEGFGLVVAEALMSGTPVIASNVAVCKELVTEKVGFICNTIKDYIAAIEKIENIRSADCRAHAMQNFHYLEMARSYMKQYEMQIANFKQQNSSE
ncbi:MAG: glycosyltransferase [Flavobacteriales bacterium]|nr:glycosyltransferase [Flavobacteriales bacterium]